MSEQAGDFVPANVVHLHLEARSGSTRLRTRRVGQVVLLQLKLLKRDQRIAIASTSSSTLSPWLASATLPSMTADAVFSLSGDSGCNVKARNSCAGVPPVPGTISRRDPIVNTNACLKAGAGLAARIAFCSNARAEIMFAGVELSCTVRGPIGPNVIDIRRSGFESAGNGESEPDSNASAAYASGDVNPSSALVVGSADVGSKAIAASAMPGITSR